jgi:arylsulfatase A-like enzyme
MTPVLKTLVIGTLLAAACTPLSEVEPSDIPRNIILVIADDLGYNDLGSYGAADIPTPHIDALANRGVRFTNAYATASVCGPSRAGLMTGRYQQRFGFEDNTGIPAYQPEHVGLPTDEITMATALKERGYTTGMVGKWHLGIDQKYHPLERGFDEFFGFLPGGRGYFDTSKLRKKNPLMRGMRAIRESEYLTDAFTREAAAFIAKHRDSPFFLCVSYNAIHTPYQTYGKYLQRVADIEDDSRKIYAAMVASLDEGVGRIVNALRENGLAERTLIAFISDHGGTGTEAEENIPLRGRKSDQYEGGIRIPYIVSAPGLLEGGSEYAALVSSLDLFPTFLALTEGTDAHQPLAKPLDGENLLPYLKKEKAGAPHDYLFWRRQQDRAARSGSWKIISQGSGPVQLYDLSSDPSEGKDLAQSMPEKLAALNRAHARWEAELIDPRWNWDALNERRIRDLGKRDPSPFSYIEGFPLE